jgi:hypothetical protein
MQVLQLRRHAITHQLSLPPPTHLLLLLSPAVAARYLSVSEEFLTEDGAAAAGWPVMFAGFLDAQYRFCLFVFFFGATP